MPLRIFTRPDLPYNAQPKHNDTRYGLLSNRNKPPTADMIDTDFDYIIDSLDILSQDIQAVAAGAIVGSNDPLNTNKLVTTDGNVTGWTFLGANNIQNGAIGTVALANGAVTTPILGDGSITEPKMVNGAVSTRVLADASINNIKIQDQVITLPKLRSSGTKCLLMGTTGSNFYTEKVADNAAQPWYVFCNNPNSPSIALNSLVDVWQNTPFTFTGTKLTANSVALPKLISSGVKCLLVGTEGSNSYAEKTADNNTQPWYVFCNNPASPTIALNSLVDVWNQTPFTFDGVKLTDNSVTIAKISGIANIRDIKNFVTATVSAVGALLRGINVTNVTHLGTGLYRVNFASQPTSGSTTYNVQVSIGGEYSCSWVNKTLNSVEVHIYTTSQYYDAPFDIVISDATA